jgi:hypothetical protein
MVRCYLILVLIPFLKYGSHASITTSLTKQGLPPLNPAFNLSQAIKYYFELMWFFLVKSSLDNKILSEIIIRRRWLLRYIQVISRWGCYSPKRGNRWIKLNNLLLSVSYAKMRICSMSCLRIIRNCQKS